MKTEQAALLRKAQESLRAAKLLSAEHLAEAFLQEAERFLGEHLPEVEKDA